MGCLHNPANVQQTSSKHPAGLMEPRPLSAYQLPTPLPISCGLSPRRAYRLSPQLIGLRVSNLSITNIINI